MYNRKRILVDLLNKSNSVDEFISLLNKEFSKEEKTLSLKPIRLNLTSAFTKSKTIKELKENIEIKLRKEANKLISNPSEEFINKLKNLKLVVYIRDEWVTSQAFCRKFEEAYLAKKLFKFKIGKLTVSSILYENNNTINDILNLVNDFSIFKLKENTPVSITTRQLIKTKKGHFAPRFKEATGKHIKILAIEDNNELRLRYKFPKDHPVSVKRI